MVRSKKLFSPVKIKQAETNRNKVTSSYFSSLIFPASDLAL
jgi:hypothetical protein